MSENVVQRASTYKVIGWVSFALAIVISPLFAVLGIIMGIAANSHEHGSGTGIVWANSIILVLGLLVTLLFYGLAGLTIFGLLRSIIGM